MKDYEEFSKWTTLQSWLLIILLSAGLLGWAMFMMIFVKDVPRQWDFGNIEFTPAKSVYSTADPAEETNSKMVTPLPEGVSMEEEQKLKIRKNSGNE